MRWKAPWSSRPWTEALAPVRREAAEEALRAAGASRRVAALLIESGYSSPAALLKAPWSAHDAGGRYQSAEWRISVQHGCTAALLVEVRSFRETLMAQESVREASA